MRLFLFLSLVACVYSVPLAARIRRQGMVLRETLLKQQMENAHLLEDLDLPSGPPAQYFTQAVDHFEAVTGNTYQQRYYMNDTFWKQGGPVFLYIDGEGAASPYDAYFGHHMEMAKMFGALVFAVEHRYYGASVPTSDLSTENLRFLSSEQALADLAVFRTAMTEQYNLQNSTFICFGGSYPGALSAWFRIKYPHLVDAAVSSSSPVHAEADFIGYNEVVATSMSTELVGGSVDCKNAIQTAFNNISMLMESTEGRASLSQMFNTCHTLVGASANDSALFIENVAGTFQGAVQYNDEIPGALNIEKMCQIMLDPSNPPLVNLANLTSVAQNGQCVDNSYADMLSQFTNITVDRDASGVGIRQWTYQTCSQFGYYQTCPQGSSCIFAPPSFTLQSNLDLCWDLFGITASEVEERVAFSDAYYGSDQPVGSNILFVNGHVDPWHYLSVLKDLSESVTSIFIEGTAHCANMQGSKPTDPPALVAARKEIENVVGHWCGQTP